MKIEWHLSRSKTFNTFLCLSVLILSSFVFSHAEIMPQQEDERDLELTRRETAVSDKLQSQLEQVLSNYYAKDTFLVNIKAYLERIPVKDINPKIKPNEKNEDEDIELPGLPIRPGDVQSKQIEDFVIDKWVFSDKYKIQYLDVLILLDEQKFNDKDSNFVRTVVKARAGIDENRGDMLTVSSMSFPPPVNAVELAHQKAAQEAEKIQESERKDTYTYIYWGAAIIAFLLFLIILLLMVSIMKGKKTQEAPYYLPSKNVPQMMPAMQMPEAIPQGISRAPASSGSPDSKPDSQRDNAMFYELRQLMVTTLIGNPKLAGEVFKKWAAAEQDNGIFQIAGFLKATDPKLMELLTEHLGSEISSKVEFAMNQMTTIDKESIVETLKKFREEFQNEQMIVRQKNSSDDMFDFLKQITPEQVFHIVKDEEPSIIALTLAQVAPDVASTIFKELPIEKQSRIPVEIGKLKKIPVSSYQDIADKLSKKAMDIKRIKYITTDGVDTLGNILEQSTPEKEQEIIASINLHDIHLADELRKVYITFDEILRIPDRSLAEVLRSFERETITKALVGADAELKLKVLGNMPPRMKIIVGDDVKRLEDSGEVSIEEVHKARRFITQKMREMAKNGILDLKKLLS